MEPRKTLPLILIKVILTITLVSTTPVFAAKIYKWVDTNGEVHYGDKPQARNAMDMKLPKSGPRDLVLQERSNKRNKLLKIYQDERQEKRQLAEKQREEQQQQEEKCAEAQQQLAEFEHASYLYELDPDGNRVILDDTKHADALSNARDDVERWCS